MGRAIRFLILGLLCFMPCTGWANELTPADRGKKALESSSFIAPIWKYSAYENAWKTWGLAQKPGNYSRAVQQRYGLHEAPYANDGLPMGLRKSSFLFVNGIAADCMLCHGGSILGKSVVGLGNTSLDIQGLFAELAASDGRNSALPLTFGHVRGTSEAGAFAVYLLGFRNPDLSLRTPRTNLDLHDDLVEDTPAWWLLKKKKTMYHTGGTDARSVRSKMQFMMTPLTSAADFSRHESTFTEIEAYLRTLQPPPYPLPIDKKRAQTGEAIFRSQCSKCHGTYGADWTYPNKIVPLAEIGTDPNRFRGITQAFGDYYNRSWFAHEKSGWIQDGYRVKPTSGYQAPPLDGIWATAPYLHNGSLPTLYDVLNSKHRPQRFTRSFGTHLEDYDEVHIGWKSQPVTRQQYERMSEREKRHVYDTTLTGRHNTGHTYGDDLTEEERMAVLEYLKGL